MVWHGIQLASFLLCGVACFLGMQFSCACTLLLFGFIGGQSIKKVGMPSPAALTGGHVCNPAVWCRATFGNGWSFCRVLMRRDHRVEQHPLRTH